MQSNSNKIREIFWPIHGIEHRKFLPLAFMMFCILFNYSLLRSVKDGFVVTEVGPEALGFMKMYMVLPSAFLATFIYQILCQYVDSKKVFYIFATFFIGYFASFAFYLLPNIKALCWPDAQVIEFSQNHPRLQWFAKILQKWPYATFYIVAELWGSMMVSLFFWQLANQVTRPAEAKRFYSMFGFLGNLGLILTGYVLTTSLQPDETGSIPASGYTNILLGLILSAIVIAFVYAWVQNVVAVDPALVDLDTSAVKKKKSKPSMMEGFKMICSSRYIGLITVLVLSYGVSMILVEGVWKAKVKDLYPTKEAYTRFMGTFQAYQGVTAMLFMLVGTNILRVVSWTTAAIITPAMILITGFFFFLFVFAGNADSGLMSFMAVANPLAVAVFIGTVQNILSKATKYSLFDATQKMAYMPLNDELKTKGMAAVEVIGGRLGKSGGGFITSSLFILFPSYNFADMTPVLGVICGLIVTTWLFAVVALGKEYEAATAARELEKAHA